MVTERLQEKRKREWTARQAMKFAILYHPRDATFQLLKLTVDRQGLDSRKSIPRASIIVVEFTAARFAEGKARFQGFVEGLKFAKRTGVT